MIQDAIQNWMRLKDVINEEYGPFNYVKEKISMNEIQWIGYA